MLHDAWNHAISSYPVSETIASRVFTINPLLIQCYPLLTLVSLVKGAMKDISLLENLDNSWQSKQTILSYVVWPNVRQLPKCQNQSHLLSLLKQHLLNSLIVQSFMCTSRPIKLSGLIYLENVYAASPEASSANFQVYFYCLWQRKALYWRDVQ